VWAVFDQAFLALSSVALNLLLARWLPPDEYGAFAFVFSIFLVLGTVYSAVLPEPMLVFGASRYAPAFTRYLRVLLVGHLLVMGAGAALFAGTGALLWLGGEPLMARAFVGWALAAPCVTLGWLLRRACFVRGRAGWAAVAGAVQFTLTLGSLWLLSAIGAVTMLGAVTVAAAASLVSSGWLAVRLGVRSPGREGPTVDTRGVVALHWRYGRWAVGAGLLAWVSTGSYYLVLPRWGGLEATAALRAMYTLGIPAAHAQAVLATLLIPSLVQLRGGPRFYALLKRGLVGFAVASLAGWLVLGAAAGPLVHAVYGGRYDQYSHLLWWVGAVPLFSGVCDILRSALRALERPDQVFWGYGAAAVTAGTLGMALTLRYGPSGASLGEMVSACAAAVVMTAGLTRARPASPPPAHPARPSSATPA
jgi:O-antigen/teichoic acid export membrane protein